MASLTFYSKNSGGANGPFMRSQSGYKWVPFNRTRGLAPTNYRVSEWVWIDGNTNINSIPLMSGGTYYMESIPEHGVNATPQSGSFRFTNSLAQGTYNRAYEKFKGKVYTAAAVLTALGERQSTFDMLADRLGQLVNGSRRLRNGDFRGFLKAFKITPKPVHKTKRWSKPSEFSSLWLEYWMGWAPAIGDVYNALDFLGKPLPKSTVRAGSRSPYNGLQILRSGLATAKSQWEGSYKVWIQGQISVSNPTLYTLNGLGLLNPAQTVWELTPFSWFVDWFTNVGAVLGQLTDWVGLRLENTFVSVKTEATASWVCAGARSVFGPSVLPTLHRERYLNVFTRNTVQTLPFVKPVFRLPNGLSLTRGMTAVSLLISMFSPNQRALP